MSETYAAVCEACGQPLAADTAAEQFAAWLRDSEASRSSAERFVDALFTRRGERDTDGVSA